MNKKTYCARALKKLRSVDLRPSRQRLVLAKLLFDGPDRHVTAEGIFNEVRETGNNISLATVYNNLNLLAERGLLKEISVDSSSSFFDTNTLKHHHFFIESSRELKDIDEREIRFSNLPCLPKGTGISGLDIVIRLEKN